MKWFKHDADASNDAKLRKLRHKYGAQGYGIYWYCLELIARNVEKHNLTFELEHDAELIAEDFRLSPEIVQEMMVFMVNLGLFENSDGVITCLKMASRTDEYTAQLIRNIKKSPDSLPIVSEDPPDNIRGIRIEENRIENNRPTKVFTPPSVEEVSAYCKERQNGIDPIAFVNHYQANGWFRGKTKIKDWKACVITWEKNRTNKPNERDEFSTRGCI